MHDRTHERGAPIRKDRDRVYVQADEDEESHCKCRFDFPQKRPSKIHQFGGLAISRWFDRRLRFWAAFRDVSVSAEGSG